MKPGEVQYTGIGYVKAPQTYRNWYRHDEYETYFIQSYGVKIGYKIIAINRSYDSSSLRLGIEPYVSGSLTYYYNNTNSDPTLFTVWNAPWLNLGLRVVFEYCMK